MLGACYTTPGCWECPSDWFLYLHLMLIHDGLYSHTIPFLTIPYQIVVNHTILYRSVPYHTVMYYTAPYITVPWYHTMP